MTDPIVKDEPVIEAQPIEPDPAPAPAAGGPGSKTEPELLLESLQKEREKRRELEQELQRVKSENAGLPLSDEGKLLQAQIDAMRARSLQEEENLKLEELKAKFPALKDKAAEFQEFRDLPENEGLRIDIVAKTFLVDRNLIGQTEPRKGLEDASGGGRVQPNQAATEQDIAELRKSNFREYQKRLRAGTLWK